MFHRKIKIIKMSCYSPVVFPPQSQYDVMQPLKPQVVVNFPEIKFFNFIEIQKFVYFIYYKWQCWYSRETQV